MQKVRSINYPSHVMADQRPEWERDIFTKCMNLTRRVVHNNPRLYPLPGIFDWSDIESAMMRGIYDGLCRVKWDIGDPVAYLVQSGIWLIRTERYRAIGKKMIFRCGFCGRELKIGETPCHDDHGKELPREGKQNPKDTEKGGKFRPTMEFREIFVAECATDLIEMYSAPLNGGIKVNGRPVIEHHTMKALEE